MAMIPRLVLDQGPPAFRLEPNGASVPGPVSDPLPGAPWPAAGSPRLAALETILAEFTERWNNGEHPRAEDYVELLGTSDPEEALELIYQEFCLAECDGLDPDPATYLDRFPAWRDRLARLFGLHDALMANEASPGRTGTSAPLPEAGDALGPYTLLRELGRGTFARVFLAEQADLEDRLVVVKVSSRGSAEPQLLARCRHPNIIEVLRHGTTGDGAIHFVCMPFLGGTTLAALLGAWRQLRRPSRTGRNLLEVFDRIAAPEYAPATEHLPARELLSRFSFAEAIAWMGARLADALDHARRRGVTHGDLKPSNVLITAEGQPMLLDFNLALDWHIPFDPAGESRGGTIAYMAPEQLRALADPAAALTRAADRHRGDVFALGLMLVEAFAGTIPDLAALGDRPLPELASALESLRSAPGSSRRLLRAVPAALRPILARCLAPDPRDRYPEAAQLAVDLDCYRAGQPPRYASAPASPRRWLRRQRRAVAAAGLMLLAGGLAASVVLVQTRHSLEAAAIAKYDAHFGGYEPGVYELRRPGVWQADHPERQAQRALRLLRAYGVLDPADWRGRADVRSLPADRREELTGFLIGEAVRLAQARLEAPETPRADLIQALEAIEHTAGPARSPTLEALTRPLRARLNRSEPHEAAVALLPAWIEAYLTGLRRERDQPRPALEAYESALAERPGGYWPSYRAAVVAARLGEFHKSARLLGRCLETFPQNPALRLQVAGLFERMGRSDLALQNCEEAVQLEPNSPSPYRSMAIIRYHLGQAESARHELQRFHYLDRVWDPEPRWRSVLESCNMGLGPHPSSANSLATALEQRLIEEPDDIEALAEKADQYRMSGQTNVALRIYEELRWKSPDHLRSSYSRAMLLRDLGHPDYITALENLIRHPRFEELLTEFHGAIRAYHVVSFEYLRRGKTDQALSIAQDGLRLSKLHKSLLGESHYALARVYAALSPHNAELLPLMRNHLRVAAKRLPSEVPNWFEVDPVFDNYRESDLWDFEDQTEFSTTLSQRRSSGAPSLP